MECPLVHLSLLKLATTVMFAGGGPTPAQLALARQQAWVNLQSFFMTMGVLRATPFVLDYVRSFFR